MESTKGIAEVDQSLQEKVLNVTQRVSKAAEQFPDKTAVSDENHSITFSELISVSDVIAKELLSRKIKMEEKVGISCGQSVEAVVSALAVMKVGGAYVPLDADYPDERLIYIAENSNMNVLFCIKGNPPKWAEGREIIEVDLDEILKSEFPKEHILVDYPPNTLAYSMYTSGSTGTPKGVEIEHRNLNQEIDWNIEFHELTSDDTASLVSSFSFDVSVSEVWSTLSVGARVCVAPPSKVYSPKNLIEWLCSAGITVALLGTPLAEKAIRLEWPEDCPVRTVRTMGDRLRVRPLPDLPFKLYNEYGPTECTVTVTAGLVSPEDDGKYPHIGKEVGDCVIHILDEELNPVQDGEEGELCISGGCVARGYAGMPEKTAEVFVPDPIIKGNRMYRTGDVAKRRPDGNIDYVGRRDLQVQIRGFRVELSEIEKYVLDSKNVNSAAIVASEEDDGIRLYCFIEPKSEPFNVKSLTDFLSSKLPTYMRPSGYYVLEKMPLNVNGKIDRKKLLADVVDNRIERHSRTDEIVKPRNPMEEVLWETWKQILRREDFGIYDNFFDLGGHSLMAIKMEALLSKRGLTLTFEKVINYPVISQLAAFLEFKVAGKESSDEKCIVTLNKGRKDRAPVYFLHSTSGDILGYANIVHTLGEDQPCFGFQSIGLWHIDQADKTIEQMASRYVKLLNEIQPEGPFALVGWCFGGWVAYEMAKIFRKQGRQVEILALIDAPAKLTGSKKLRQYLTIIKNLIALGPAEMTKEIVKRLKTKESDLAADVIGAHFDEQDEEFKNRYVSNRAEVYDHNLAAAYAYKAGSYDDKVVLFKALDSELWKLRGQKLGWELVVDHLQLEIIPGEHKDLMKENSEIALRLRKMIEDISV
ncbi:amino acid adenylation domain-containing protein [Sedimentisphaera salicampi]|uniref:amino acid adenylation domain-containing protein n=1 Tax=Sedimentisphaera salicampi TaxID=1941349 RepID=UPI000B9BEAA4|nr:amino acid adenylation domain-containing protein [Sedimentisphaera salicampi]OXU14685.1 Dimodular nonribosomal peptide synthase [Sedimentisphaera salicampi]